ncbi:BEL1-like homeodomain protein 1 [Nicotiana tabacum]|uniref:BEL1-like homeodomain protein 1 n=2 Tax=Nicotiana tabacum TaxID=4097 RepID=A0AC58RZ36_TOBAC
MAMYYQGSSEIQADGLQTLYLMNPNYIGYTDTQQQQQQHLQQANMFFLNSATAGNLAHGPLPSQAHTQHFVGVPLPTSFHDPSRPSVHDVSASHHGLLQRLWSSDVQNSGGGGGGGGRNESQSHIPTAVVSPNCGGGTTTDFASQLGFQRPGLVSPTQQHQGLSLSLSPQQQQQQQQMNFRSFPLDHHEISPHTNHQVGILSSSSPRTNTNNNHIRGSGASSSSFSNGMIVGSKYLKAAQELLDEVVNVGKSIKEVGAKEKDKLLDNELMPLSSDVAAAAPTSGSGETSSQKNSVAELTTVQRQELQMKKAKLISMLDEVEQRYRQYHHQMQIIVASFEEAAGIGSAKSYTQLALHTISKQFRCLKDAITGQIKATSKSLGEEDISLGGKIEGSSSRLRYVDHHLRQQRALQQLGMMQPNAWRPQRGLPERAVSVLRAWLFEHFLHPYPKDSDKIMLAKQTGLTRSQVSNWFINARVRLWKPMVEEMYLEEVKNNQEQNGLEENANNIEPNKEMRTKSSSPQETTNLRKDKQISSILQDASPTEISCSTISTSPTAGSLPAQAAGFSFIGSLNMENSTSERNNKKPRNDMQNSSSSILSMETEMKAGDTRKGEKFNGDNRQARDQSYPLMTAYSTMGEFGRFNPEQQMATRFQGNGVSLTLGLPPSENLVLSGNQHNFLPNQNIGIEMGRIETHYNRMTNPQPSHPSITYENIDFQSGKRYAAQLLPDFVS